MKVLKCLFCLLPLYAVGCTGQQHQDRAEKQKISTFQKAVVKELPQSLRDLTWTNVDAKNYRFVEERQISVAERLLADKRFCRLTEMELGEFQQGENSPGSAYLLWAMRPTTSVNGIFLQTQDGARLLWLTGGGLGSHAGNGFEEWPLLVVVPFELEDFYLTYSFAD